MPNHSTLVRTSWLDIFWCSLVLFLSNYCRPHIHTNHATLLYRPIIGAQLQLGEKKNTQSFMSVYIFVYSVHSRVTSRADFCLAGIRLRSEEEKCIQEDIALFNPTLQQRYKIYKIITQKTKLLTFSKYFNPFS